MGYPGYRDLWDNPFLGRLASHPWAAMRAVGAFLGGGVMDRFPNLRYGILPAPSGQRRHAIRRARCRAQ